jgi:hypothetical protein
MSDFIERIAGSIVGQHCIFEEKILYFYGRIVRWD